MTFVYESFKLYRSNFLPILLLSFSIVFPLLVVLAILTNYAYGVTELLPGSTAVADFAYGFLTLLFLTLAQVPFIQFTLSDREGSEHPLKDTYLTFVKQGFPVYVFGVLYCVLVCLGFAVLIVPGIAVMVLLFLTPYISIIKGLPPRQSLRVAVSLAKKHFIQIAGLLLFTSLAELAVELAALYGMAYVTTDYLAILLTQMLLNVFLFPLVVITIANCVLDWKEKSRL